MTVVVVVPLLVLVPVVPVSVVVPVVVAAVAVVAVVVLVVLLAGDGTSHAVIVDAPCCCSCGGGGGLFIRSVCGGLFIRSVFLFHCCRLRRHDYSVAVLAVFCLLLLSSHACPRWRPGPGPCTVCQWSKRSLRNISSQAAPPL